MKMQLFKRAAVRNLPLALSVKTSTKFEEDDGLWSSFDLVIGDGPGGGQNFRVIISTSSFDTWVTLPPGCQNLSFTPPNCAYSRGVGLYLGTQSTGYNVTDSNTAKPKGEISIVKQLQVGELDASSLFGTKYGNVSGALYADYLHMSSSTGSDASQNSSQPVPILGVKSVLYYLSTFGIGVGAHKTTVQSLQLNSTVLSMANAGAIPSESWGYTAGAHYG
jgi:hypothetical protein